MEKQPLWFALALVVLTMSAPAQGQSGLPDSSRAELDPLFSAFEAIACAHARVDTMLFARLQVEAFLMWDLQADDAEYTKLKRNNDYWVYKGRRWEGTKRFLSSYGYEDSLSRRQREIELCPPAEQQERGAALTAYKKGVLQDLAAFALIRIAVADTTEHLFDTGYIQARSDSLAATLP